MLRRAHAKEWALGKGQAVASGDSQEVWARQAAGVSGETTES